MAPRAPSMNREDREVVRVKNRLVLDEARAGGLLGAPRDTRLSGRLPAALVAAARRRANVTSDTQLLELALSRLALEDDFGARLVARRGSIPAELDLEF